MNLLDFFFPKHSLSGHGDEWVTQLERSVIRQQMQPVKLEKEKLQEKGMPSIDSLIASGMYISSPLLKKAIRTFKYHHVKGLHEELAQLLVDSLEHFQMPQEFLPFLCPVPLHWTRRFARGFNQSEVLAKDVARAKGWPIENFLKRVRPTGHQAWREKSERKDAVADAFVLRKGIQLPEHVILVDDICTTGATLEACAKVLKNAGISRIDALVVALG